MLDLATAHHEVAYIQEIQGRLEEAASALNAEVAIRERLRSNDPELAGFEDLLAHASYAEVLAALGRHVEATSELEEARAVFESLHDRGVGPPTDLIGSRIDGCAGRLAAARGDSDNALRLYIKATEALEQARQPGEISHFELPLAVWLARCASVAPADKRTDYQDRAIEALERAAEGWMRNSELLWVSDDFESLHERDAFLRLIEGLGPPQETFLDE